MPEPVLLRRDDALEAAVLERMVLDVQREPPLARVEARALGHGPGEQHAVQFEAEIVVQGTRGMLLDDELEPGRATPAEAPTRLRRCAEISLPAVGLESHLEGVKRSPL